MTKREILDAVEECRKLRAWGRDDEADGELGSLAINLYLDLQSEAGRGDRPDLAVPLRQLVAALPPGGSVTFRRDD